MIHTILVPLDGSTFAEHALPLALAIARRTGAPLQLARVQWGPSSPAELTTVAVMEGLDATLRADEHNYLAKQACIVSGLTGESPKVVLLDGDVAPALRNYTVASGADLVIMSTHGRGPLSRFWLGSVANELVRDLPVPLLLVRPKDGPACLAHEEKVSSVLVPLDGTPEAEEILEPALAVGIPFGAHFTVVRVVAPLLALANVPEGSGVEQMAGLQVICVIINEGRLLTSLVANVLTLAQP